ncbi:formate-dependent phosphoribosylglycinamide formyltransferase [Mycolicibacterium fortuitum]|uniref:Formate-dependent phosphoribosylglycinamide formyltransferase n=2 Tax=Mycolicibacterium fortuitum TaxID=1766 RepID=A0AAE4VC96_MYCFO|nr:formate-dependent phosphoribosylglycinamide formyltransferase [Mycolicibacterium fortuitum]MCV7142131.1 formate-dependent phosphoribosylglycinamide formyltransferase [Mycolicibacterium fortuitum]MDV7192182.1 formate-dependent phosphoribosylglycinamide formyltransferase [Mycolicibacterium fortuitum]MDV7204913.1 formate-dependent phosphoribosylglycinamide formyltransferase [Mycolicibacterium fortuitum]MDV7226794.1 formate-dependent phosphoribosylglycinamide formyltransferase [Mycolicibacterium
MSESIEDAQPARETTDPTDDQVDGAQEADGSKEQTEAAGLDTGKPADPAATVLLLGSGELSRELALAFQRLGGVVVAADRYYAPAHGVADRSAVIKMNDAEELAALIEREKPRYVVAESGVIAADALIAVAERGDIEVLPTPRSIRLSQDREGLRRLASDELGLPTVPFWFAGSVEELTAVAEHAGFPLVVKPVVGALRDGESVMLRRDDVEPAWQRATTAGQFAHNRVLAESVVEVEYEITMLTVRTAGPSGPGVQFCEPIGHRQVGTDLLESWQPQPLTPAALDAAKSISARIVNSLGGRGVFGVELLVAGDDVYFSDVRIRPHDSGLVTLRSQRLSEFELHARAILGLAVDTIMISPAAAEVSYGGADTGVPAADINSVLSEALATSESDVRLFGNPGESESPRRLGVALATAPDVIIARDRARRVGSALRKLW